MSQRDVDEAEFDAMFGRGSHDVFDVGTLGDQVSEAEFDALFEGKADSAESRAWRRDVADFRRVGLQPAVAEKAARSLRRDTYGTFEEAAVMCSTNFGSDNKPSRVQLGVLETVKAERAKDAAAAEEGRFLR